jgi:glycosyltransferase involved in cell wall biosynthesis
MKIGIISTFGEAEANGSYSCALKNEFIRQGHEVKCFELSFDVFCQSSSSTHSYADKLINEWKNDLKNYDYISIQYEFGLFGTDISVVLQRISSLIDACQDNCFSVTFHRIDLNEPLIEYKKIKRKGIDRLLCKLKLKRKYEKVTALTFDTLTRIFLKKIVEKKGLAIVHTKRDELKIKGEFPEIDVASHPLTYFTPEDIKNKKQSFSKSDFKQKFGIKENKSVKAIGVLGTFHPWKDYTTCVKALKLLDNSYHLYIWGGAHKLHWAQEPTGLQRIMQLQDFIAAQNLTDRVHFMGVLPKDEDLMQAFIFSDYVILPYAEVGEMGSASMGNALELSSRVFATRNCCFDELKKFTGEAFFSFDIGNWMELAEKIKNLPQEDEINENRSKYIENYNISKTVQLYLKKMGKETK